MDRVTRFGVSLEGELLARFDELAGELGYDNRSEALRDLIRQRLLARDFERGVASGSGDAWAVVTLVYDHHELELPKRLTEAQHAHHEAVVSTLHVHLSHDECLEVLVGRGRAASVKELGEKLTSLRGVRNGRLVVASVGVGGR